MSRVMIDLETMGLLPGCAILSIGAVVFDPLGRDIGELGAPGQFYQNIDLLSCVMAGLEVDPATARWWQEQDEKAKAALYEKPMSIRYSLTKFSAWLESVDADQLWANGPMSDIAWLEEAYRRCGMKAPWVAQQGGHRRPRDYRTIVEAAELVAGFDRATIPEPTVKHDALADARAQAVGVQMAFAALTSMGTAAVVAEYDEMDRFLESLAKPSEPGYTAPRPEIVSTEAVGRGARLPVFRDGAPPSQSTGLREERKAAIRAELWPLEKMSLSEDAQKAKDSIS